MVFSRYKEALSIPDKAKAELASRCETVLNTTMAEMDIYHTQKVEDFERLAREHLDGEIRLYEQVSDTNNNFLLPPSAHIFEYFSPTDSKTPPERTSNSRIPRPITHLPTTHALPLHA